MIKGLSFCFLMKKYEANLNALLVCLQYEFGIHSCYHESVVAIGVRVGLGVLLHIMCSYITFPLYALVTQVRINFNQNRIYINIISNIFNTQKDKYT